MSKENETSLNIYQRINEVRKKVSYVQKDKEVQGYKAVTHDAVTAMVRNELIEHGIVIIPTQKSDENEVVGTTAKGSAIYRYTGRYEIIFRNVDFPEDYFCISVTAQANDMSDKGPGKALSYATKYAILKVFNIETGEDEESRVESYESIGPISQDKAEIVHRLIESSGTNEKEFLAWAGADSVEEIKQGDYARIYAQLKRKETKQAKEAQEAA